MTKNDNNKDNNDNNNDNDFKLHPQNLNFFHFNQYLTNNYLDLFLL